tara:strand:- start:4376 stop:5491 length:1116 start_codon:yes stop_codon:yes gene_type:complete
MKDYKKNNTILIAGGGSGGHLFPALAIGDELYNEGYDIKYIGSKYGIESKILKQMKKEHYLLNITGIQRKLSFKNIINNLLFPFRFLFSYLIIKIILRKLNPIMVIGTGGYASGLPLLASIRTNIKTLIHEQNSYPGLTTRKLSNKVDLVCITNSATKKYLNGNMVLTGIPIRNNFLKINKLDACSKLGLSANKKTIFVVGGSQGSEAFNRYFKKNYEFYIKNDIQLIWQCGYKHLSNYEKITNNKNILIKDFFDNIDYAYCAADIVISRAGAMALNEISFMEKTMILIPLPSSAENHQFYNAKFFQDNNAALMIEEKDLRNNIIEDSVTELFKNKNNVQSMGINASKLIIKNAKEKIISQIYKLLENKSI